MGLLVAIVKEETQGKKLDSEIFLIPLSPLSLLLSYLVLGGETEGIKGGKKKYPRSSKGQLRVRVHVVHVWGGQRTGHHVGFRDGTQVISLGGRQCYFPNCLVSQRSLCGR